MHTPRWWVQGRVVDLVAGASERRVASGIFGHGRTAADFNVPVCMTSVDNVYVLVDRNSGCWAGPVPALFFF
jgi:hypothetical protein